MWEKSNCHHILLFLCFPTCSPPSPLSDLCILFVQVMPPFLSSHLSLHHADKCSNPFPQLPVDASCNNPPPYCKNHNRCTINVDSSIVEAAGGVIDWYNIMENKAKCLSYTCMLDGLFWSLCTHCPEYTAIVPEVKPSTTQVNSFKGPWMPWNLRRPYYAVRAAAKWSSPLNILEIMHSQACSDLLKHKPW